MTKVCEILLAALLMIAPAFGQTGASGNSTPKSQSAPAGVRRQKLANPLNELLDEAQRDMDKKDFAAAIDPLQKFIAEQPDVAYGHFQLAYAFTALHKSAEARAEYERALAIDPKMAEAYLNLGVLLIDSDAAASVTNLRKGWICFRRRAIRDIYWAWRRSGRAILPARRNLSKGLTGWIRKIRSRLFTWRICICG